MTKAPQLNLRAILTAERARPRGDELQAHVSDLYACDRATWYRRQGMEHAPFSPEKLALFDQGHAYEQQVRTRLVQAHVALRASNDVDVLGLVGHCDLILIDHRVVVDTKLTKLREPKPIVSPHYALQVAAYAMALGWREGTVYVFHLGSDIEKQYDIDTRDLAQDGQGAAFGGDLLGATWHDVVVTRAIEVLRDTAPDAPQPPAIPNPISPWGCRYCDWHQCERNPKFTSDGDIPT